MRILTVAIAFILVATFAWSQPAGPALTGLKAYLSLTDGQVQSLQSIESNLRSSTMYQRQQIAAKQAELNAALKSGGTSAVALGQLQLDIQALQKQIADADAAARPQLLAVLIPAQQALLDKLVEAQKLQPTVREAEMMGLIAPAGGRGPGPGMGRGMGPGAGPAGRGGPLMAPRGGRQGAPPPPRP